MEIGGSAKQKYLYCKNGPPPADVFCITDKERGQPATTTQVQVQDQVQVPVGSGPSGYAVFLNISSRD